MAKEPPLSDPAETPLRTGGVKSLEDRVKQLEETIERTPASDKWYDRIQVSGRVEVETGYQEIDYGDAAQEDEKTSDVDLATAELVFDAKITTHVDGHVMLKFENDELFIGGYLKTPTWPSNTCMTSSRIMSSKSTL